MNTLTKEIQEIEEAIRPFFSPQKWFEFYFFRPDNTLALYEYLRDEWYRIAAEFEIEVQS